MEWVILGRIIYGSEREFLSGKDLVIRFGLRGSSIDTDHSSTFGKRCQLQVLLFV
jgi:hypothetical protein